MGNLCCPTKYPLSSEAKLRARSDDDPRRRPVDDTVVSRPVSRGSYTLTNSDDAAVYHANVPDTPPPGPPKDASGYVVSEDDVNTFFVGDVIQRVMNRDQPPQQTTHHTTVAHAQRLPINGDGPLPKRAEEKDDVTKGTFPGPNTDNMKAVTDTTRFVAPSTTSDKYRVAGLRTPAKEIVEENRDLNEIWTKLEMIEENICCGDVSAPEDTLYASYLGNANEISDLQDLLLDGQDSGEDGSVTACTSADVAHTGCEAATQTYLKDISTNNKQTARRLARCKSSGDTNAALKQLLAEHKRRQTEFRRNRDLQIKKLHAKLHDHLSTRPAMPKADVVSPACVVVEQPANVTKESTHAEQEEYSTSEYESSSGSDSGDDQESNEENAALNITLTNDVKSRMNEMTSRDFTSLLGVYRKLEKRQSGTETGPSTLLRSKGAALEGREAPRLVTEANPTQLQTPNRIEEDKKLDAELESKFVSKALKETTDREALRGLFKAHLSTVELLRRNRAEYRTEHDQKLLKRLGEQQETHGRQEQTSENEHTGGGDNKQDLDTLKEKYCKEIANVNLPLSKEDIENVLSKYYSERAALLQARSSDRTRLNERLQERIDNMRNATTEEERNDSDQVVADMDQTFYDRLCEMRSERPLEDDQLNSLLGDHMLKVRRFRKSVVIQRREERLQAGPLGIDDVNSLVEQERKDAQRLKDIRHEEREKTDNLLKEKLKRKKERQRRYADQPELPSRERRERHSRKGKRPTGAEHRLLYENVELKNK